MENTTEMTKYDKMPKKEKKLIVPEDSEEEKNSDDEPIIEDDKIINGIEENEGQNYYENEEKENFDSIESKINFQQIMYSKSYLNTKKQMEKKSVENCYKYCKYCCKCKNCVDRNFMANFYPFFAKLSYSIFNKCYKKQYCCCYSKKFEEDRRIKLRCTLNECYSNDPVHYNNTLKKSYNCYSVCCICSSALITSGSYVFWDYTFTSLENWLDYSLLTSMTCTCYQGATSLCCSILNYFCPDPNPEFPEYIKDLKILTKKKKPIQNMGVLLEVSKNNSKMV